VATRVVEGAVVARQGFFVGNRLVPGGEVWAADDPLVKAYKANFRPLEAQESDPPKPARPVRTSRPVGARTLTRPFTRRK
jgi:hypothetical protein